MENLARIIEMDVLSADIIKTVYSTDDVENNGEEKDSDA